MTVSTVIVFALISLLSLAIFIFIRSRPSDEMLHTRKVEQGFNLQKVTSRTEDDKREHLDGEGQKVYTRSITVEFANSSDINSSVANILSNPEWRETTHAGYADGSVVQKLVNLSDKVCIDVQVYENSSSTNNFILRAGADTDCKKYLGL